MGVFRVKLCLEPVAIGAEAVERAAGLDMLRIGNGPEVLAGVVAPGARSRQPIEKGLDAVVGDVGMQLAGDGG